MELAPDCDLSDIKSNYLSRWHLIQKIFQNFWVQWKTDYLNQLQIRKKWQTQKPELNVNDLVMIKDETLPATKWALGRVVEKHPGTDGLTRVVSIKTAKNVLKRAITKVAPMPIEVKQNETTKTTGVGLTKMGSVGLVTLLMTMLSSINTTEAHDFTLFKTDQKLDNKHEISISLLNSGNFSLLTIFSIFCVLFFLFLIYIIWIIYNGSVTTPTNMGIQTEKTNSKNETVEIPMTTITSPHINVPPGKILASPENLNAPTGTTITNWNEQSFYMYQQMLQQQQQTMTHIHTPVPTMRNLIKPTRTDDQISPLVKLEEEFYKERRHSSCIYPLHDLKKLKENIE